MHGCFLTVAFQNFRELTLIVYLTALTVSEPLIQLVIPIGWKIADVTEIADVTGIVTVSDVSYFCVAYLAGSVARHRLPLLF